MSRSRRAYLTALGVGATSLAGCASSAEDEATTESTETSRLTETTKETGTTATAEETTATRTAEPTSTAAQQSSVEVPKIEIVNKHREPHQFHVLVLDGEEPVFWRSYRADGAEFEDGRISRATGTVWKDPLPESAGFTVYARVGNRTEWGRLTPDEGDSCVYVELQLEPDGRFVLQHGHPEC